MSLSGLSFEIPKPVAYLIFAIFFVAVFSFLTLLRLTKKKRSFISKLIHQLMEQGATKIKVMEKKSYQISYYYQMEYYYLKIMMGGSRKGIVMTNATTVFGQHFRNETSANKSSEIERNLIPFLSEEFDGHKVIVIYGNLMRATRYINENELEAITYKKDAFKVRFVEEKYFKDYLILIAKEAKDGTNSHRRNKHSRD